MQMLTERIDALDMELAELSSQQVAYCTQSEFIHDQRVERQHYYNWDIPHSAHVGRSPMEHFLN